MRNISPKKARTFFVCFCLCKRKVILLLPRNLGKVGINAGTEKKDKESVTRKMRVDWAAKKTVRLEPPLARRWALSLSKKAEKCPYEVYSGCFTAGKLRSAARIQVGTSHRRSWCTPTTSLTDSLKFRGTRSRYYSSSCWRGYRLVSEQHSKFCPQLGYFILKGLVL